jgi:hypothetical protein
VTLLLLSKHVLVSAVYFAHGLLARGGQFCCCYVNVHSMDCLHVVGSSASLQGDMQVPSLIKTGSMEEAGL